MHKWLLKSMTLLISICLSMPSFAERFLLNTRISTQKQQTRVIFDLSAPSIYHIDHNEQQQRLTVEFQGTIPKSHLQPSKFNPTVISSIQQKQNGQNTLIIINYKQAMTVKHFVLPAQYPYKDRMVIDFISKKNNTSAISAKTTKTTKTTKASPFTMTPIVDAQKLRVRNFIIAIDAGHGGEDPGAAGKFGSQEKDIVLNIAEKLANQIKYQSNMKPVLIRDGDYYLGLQQRVAKARRAQADLFVSIHADAFRDERAQGASIYTLSARGASSGAAKWLAEKENQADLIGGIKLDDKDEILASVLLDLSQTASNEASTIIGRTVLNEIQHISPLHNNRIQQAGFVVLKSPDIPSMLIETGFISNGAEERKLTSMRFQHQIATAIANGIANYFKDKPKPVLYRNQPDYSEQKYRIQAGDTLSKLASRFHTSQSFLKHINGLSTDELIIGQIVKVPTQG